MQQWMQRILGGIWGRNVVASRCESVATEQKDEMDERIFRIDIYCSLGCSSCGLAIGLYVAV